VAFFGLLATGLALYIPSIATVISDRPLVKALHLGIAISWLLALALVVVLGDRRSLRLAFREVDRFDRDDRDWLLGRHRPQGRFNAGQKIHAVIQAAFAVLFTLSGVLLWLGERNTRFRLSGTVSLHDGLMFIAIVLVAGHLWLALSWPPTRPSLRGMVRGTVRRDWALEHHSKWRPDDVAPVRERSGPAIRAIVLAAGLIACAVLVLLYVIGS
jgi:formate dehydrogenase subunit gamma